MVKQYRRLLEITEQAKESLMEDDLKSLEQAVEKRESVMGEIDASVSESQIKVGESQRVKAMLEAVQRLDGEIMEALTAKMKKGLARAKDLSLESRALTAYGKIATGKKDAFGKMKKPR